MKNEQWIIITIAGILIMVIAVTLLVNYYYNEKEKECISQPFIYEAKKLENLMGHDIFCSCRFLVPIGYESPIITFNSENISVK